MVTIKIKKLSLLILSSFVFSSVIHATGFEQLLMWSGKNVGRANAVTSIVDGPEALFFNPAGLSDGSKNEVVVNATYLWDQFKAPVLADGQSMKSNAGNSFTGSAFYTRSINDKLTLGLGAFPSAGLKVDYPTQDIGVPVAPKADFKVLEISTGAAYKITDKLSVGLAYRVSYTSANFTTILPGTPPSAAAFSNMTGWDFFSFRGGLQYKDEKWGAGLNIRTPFVAKTSGKLDASSGLGSASDDSAKLSTTFPLEIALAGHYLVTPALTLLLEYDFLNYQAADKLKTTDTLGVPDLPLKWKNGHVFRLAADWAVSQSENMKQFIRGGYTLQTAITNTSTMIPTSEPPGLGHLFSAGYGVEIGKNLNIDGSVFYGFSDKTVASNSPFLGGKYSIQGLGVNVGAGYKF